jgi:hypothetical protein
MREAPSSEKQFTFRDPLFSFQGSLPKSQKRKTTNDLGFSKA